MRRQTPEGAVKAAVAEFLAISRLRFHRLNSGMIVAESKGRRRAIRMCPAGTPDFVVFLRGCLGGCSRVLYIETKAPRSGRQSDAQKAFQAEVEAEGHFYLLVDDVRQVADFLMGVR